MHFMQTLLDIILPPSERVRYARTITTSELEQYVNYPTVSGYPRALALVPYRAPPVAACICALKFDGVRSMADTCATLLYPHLIAHLGEYEHVYSLADVTIVPVPLSSRRYRTRGYNHVHRIGQRLVQLDAGTCLRWAPHALTRTRDTAPQSQQQSREARRQNIANAFQADARHVSGRTIVLLDDVITSGATMQAASEALTTAGAKDVLPVAIAAGGNWNTP